MSTPNRPAPFEGEVMSILRKIFVGQGRVAEWLEMALAPRVRVRYGWGQPVHGPSQAIFEHHHEAQAAFVARLAGLADRFAAIPASAAGAAPTPRWAVEHFPPLDTMAAYAIVDLVRPRRIVEIGIGDSTKVFRRAIDDLGLDCTLVGIDPQPRPDVFDIVDKLRIGLLQDLDLALFDDGEGPDLIFFDGSHRVFQNGDVATFFLDVLPRLRADAVVGIHDIFLPRDYPAHFRGSLYGEQYMVAAYMIAQGTEFPLVFSCAYASTAFAEAIATVLPPDTRAAIAAHGRTLGGTTLWFRPPAWRKP